LIPLGRIQISLAKVSISPFSDLMASAFPWNWKKKSRYPVNNKIPRVSFMTSLGVNVGDEFIREGVRAVLDLSLGAYAPFYVNKVDQSSLHSSREDETERIGDKFDDVDIFIQTGAPVYWCLNDGAATSLNSEWYQWLWEEKIFRSDGPNPLFINLGAGSCQSWDDHGESFLKDGACVRFAKRAAARSIVTTIRDPVAEHICAELKISAQGMPCPAFLAAARHRPERPPVEKILINLMPLGGHYRIDPKLDEERWLRTCDQLLAALRVEFEVLFVAHDRIELKFLEELSKDDERVFFSENWRDYLDVYSVGCVTIANRVHGAVASAGFGVPSLIIGNDSRARIGDYIGLPVYRSATVSIPEVLAKAIDFKSQRTSESERLLNLRQATLRSYARLLRRACDWSARP
jgi:polysaccharide pyruvyl transferase